MQFSLTASITGRILNSFSLLFFGLSFVVLSAIWRYFRNYLYRLLDIKLAIVG